jgi:hypothetical protein
MLRFRFGKLKIKLFLATLLPSLLMRVLAFYLGKFSHLVPISKPEKCGGGGAM